MIVSIFLVQYVQLMLIAHNYSSKNGYILFTYYLHIKNILYTNVVIFFNCQDVK